ncbi:DUF3291 domain-containing protein [Neolewinella sp.]|uniref:DUF3291 domain-containing protein n=1 Tax=Neolewinella sp. TaxID=2993543 RepID=UPI003B52B538
MQLAQINIARLRAPLDAPATKEFNDFIAPINQLAEESPGFVWRLTGNFGESSAQVSHPFGDEMILVNMSVWESIEALREFSYKTVHSYFVRSRSKWFHRLEHPHLALWWVAEGHRPSLVEAKERLELIDADGPTQHAFSLATTFAPAVPADREATIGREG